MRIRDGKNSGMGSGINIPDPQHWLLFWWRNVFCQGGEGAPAQGYGRQAGQQEAQAFPWPQERALYLQLNS